MGKGAGRMRSSGMSIACGLLALAQPAIAAPADPPTLPGGTLDTHFPGLDVYAAPPPAAKPPATPACAAAQGYVDRINAGQFGAVADLFADDGLLYHGPGHYHRGLAAIRDFYEGTIGPQKPQIRAVDFVGAGEECVVALASNTAMGATRRFMLASVDLFTVGRDGKVTRMIAFGRKREAPIPTQ
jgi:hypothetical protein